LLRSMGSIGPLNSTESIVAARTIQIPALRSL
jgi:hypothetical protein